MRNFINFALPPTFVFGGYDSLTGKQATQAKEKNIVDSQRTVYEYLASRYRKSVSIRDRQRKQKHLYWDKSQYKFVNGAWIGEKSKNKKGLVDTWDSVFLDSIGI